jgi:hypothetical protein
LNGLDDREERMKSEEAEMSYVPGELLEELHTHGDQCGSTVSTSSRDELELLPGGVLDVEGLDGSDVLHRKKTRRQMIYDERRGGGEVLRLTIWMTWILRSICSGVAEE